MFDKSLFFGKGEDVYSSLKNYGFVCRNEKSDQYYLIYKYNDSSYDEGFINESTMNELVSEKETYLDKENLNKFLNSNNLTRESFIGLNILDKLDLMLKEFGAEEVMGKSSQALTFEEAFHIVETE
jgi:hypothetical protein